MIRRGCFDTSFARPAYKAAGGNDASCPPRFGDATITPNEVNTLLPSLCSGLCSLNPQTRKETIKRGSPWAQGLRVAGALSGPGIILKQGSCPSYLVSESEGAEPSISPPATSLSRELGLLTRATKSLVNWVSGPASFRNLVEMRILGSNPRPAELENSRGHQCVNNPLQVNLVFTRL